MQGLQRASHLCTNRTSVLHLTYNFIPHSSGNPALLSSATHAGKISSPSFLLVSGCIEYFLPQTGNVFIYFLPVWPTSSSSLIYQSLLVFSHMCPSLSFYSTPVQFNSPINDIIPVVFSTDEFCSPRLILFH